MTEITKRALSERLARLHADYAALPVIQPQLKWMHQAYTVKADARCGDCVQCQTIKASGRLTCRLYYGATRKPAYWAAIWTACGLFEGREDVRE